MPGTFVHSKPAMVPQPPPVAPKSGAAKVTFQSWQQAQKIELLSDELSPYGNHVRCGSVDSVDSNSSSSVSSSSSSSSGVHCRQLSNDGEYIPTRTVGKAPTLPPNHNPLQFVKVHSPLYKKAEQQIKITKEVKISKDTLKETEEEWQSNLDNWKSRRRKVSEKVIQRAEEMRQIEAEEQLRQLKQKEQQGKIKTFSQIVEKRSTKRTYNLDLYIGQGDDSGVGGTPEPDEQEGACLDNQHLSLRSDTSEGMTSETDSIDSDVHSSEKIMKEPPKVPKKPHSWLARKDSGDSVSCRKSSLNNHCLTGKDLMSENASSTEPSDIECHAADTETVSSEDDAGFCQPVRQVDSGLDSLCDSHRPNDTADSASDLSQDSCSGIDKTVADIEPETASSDEVEEHRPRPMLKKRPLVKSVSIRDDDFLDDDDGKIHIKMVVKQGLDSKGFGFNLKGGKDQGYEAYIDSVSPSTPADLAGLKKGDKVLSLNGEPTDEYSHSSLVFSIKQATYSGELEMIVSRPPEADLSQIDQKKSNKSGTLADKIALFSGNSHSSHSLKSSKSQAEDESRPSLVLRRRSAFEKSRTEVVDETRRSSCASPENIQCEVEDRRHSIAIGSSIEKVQDGNFKKPPPPVPLKPKLRSKPRLVSQSSINEPDFPEMLPSDIVSENGDVSNSFSNNTYTTYMDNSSSETSDFIKYDNLETKNEDSSAETKVDVYQEATGCYEAQSTGNFEAQVTDSYEAQSTGYEAQVTGFYEAEPVGSVYSTKALEPLEIPCEQLSDNVFSTDESAVADNSSPDMISLSPKYVDNVVNTVEEISVSIKSVSLCNIPEPPTFESAEITNSHIVENNDEVLGQTFEAETCAETETVLITNENCLQPTDNEFGDDCYDNEEAFMCEKDNVCESEVTEEQLIIDSDVSSISREDFVQISMHPLGLPLEKIDEDEGGVSASTTPSSDTPDTETIIDNLPTNISPLPNDEVEVVDGNSMVDTYMVSGDQINDEAIRTSPENMDPTPELTTEDAERNVLDDLVNYSETVSASCISGAADLCYDDENDEEKYEQERADQLSPLDVIDQIEMKLMQQLEQDALEDLTDNTNGHLEESVHRELLYLSEDADLLDDLDAPRNVVPPSEPPPPPPPEPDVSENKANPFQRINSTKRIKKEIWRRRSDFLGLGSPEAITVDDLPPPPPGLEELLKSEMELEREQRLFLEKQLSLSEAEYTATETYNATSDSYNPEEECTADYSLEVLDSEAYDAVAPDEPTESWKDENECQIPVSDLDVEEKTIETVEKVETSKQTESPQHKAKTHIQSLGAAPRAKIMDSNKWITQTERHVPVLKQKSVEPVFREASYNQNFWIAQEANRRAPAARSHVPVDRRYSMPPAYGNTRQPSVTVRTWGDRELEYQPQPRPKSAIWQEHPAAVAQNYPPPPAPTYGYSEGYGSHRSSWSENMSHRMPEEQQQHFDLRHHCSYCGSPLTEGSAMGIDALQLYFHIECFRCCICHLQLGNGTCGTDVQVKNSQLYCPKCFLIE